MKKITEEHAVIPTTGYKHPEWELKPAAEVRLLVIDPTILLFGRKSVGVEIVFSFSFSRTEEELTITLDDCIDEREIAEESTVSIRHLLDQASIWGAGHAINILCVNALMKRARLEIERYDEETEIRVFIGSYATNKRIATEELTSFVKFN